MYNQKSESWLSRPKSSCRHGSQTYDKTYGLTPCISRISNRCLTPTSSQMMWCLIRLHPHKQTATSSSLNARNQTHFTLFFSYGDADLPQITGLNFNAKDAFITEPSLNQDTIIYWLRDTALVNQDTLRMQMLYNMTDSAGKLVPKTDTLEILSKVPYAKRLKRQQEEYDKWVKKAREGKRTWKSV